MEENKNNPQQHNFFDQLMFGPPRQPTQNQQQNEEETQHIQSTNKRSDSPHPQGNEINQASPEANTQLSDASNSQNNNQVPEVDMVQMMQQFDNMMNLANKLGPSLKKLGPIFDLLKQFSGPKK